MVDSKSGHNRTGSFAECFICLFLHPKLMTVMCNVNNTNNVLVFYLQWLVVYDKANTEMIDLDLKAKQWLTTPVSMTKTISRKFIPLP